MSRVKLTAGCAIDGGVMFSSKEFYAIARYPKNTRLDKLKAEAGQGELKDENELEIVSGKVDPPVGGRLLNKLPIIGALIGLFVTLFQNNDREPWKTVKNTEGAPTMAKLGGILLIGIIYSVLGGFSYLVGSWTAELFGIAPSTFWYGFLSSLMIPVVLVGVILLAAHYINGDMLNFHGAEHKVGNAYRKKLELTHENVQAQSKHHPNCSTNLVVNAAIAYPFVIGLLYVWLDSFVLAIILGVIVEYIVNLELLRISTWIGNNFLAYIFNFFGLLAQRITVREPEERHIHAAISAMNKVLELEHGKQGS